VEDESRVRSAARPNLALRRRMEHAGISEARLAQVTTIDVRTIHRWLQGETVPQTRNARATADALGCDLEDLWPDIFPVLDPPSAGTVPVSAYGSRAQIPVQAWRDHFGSASSQIDICVYGGTFLFDAVPGFAHILADATDRGVKIRFLVGDPEAVAVQRRGEEEAIGDSLPARCRLTLARLSALPPADRLQIRTHRTALYASLFRSDDTLIANHHIYGSPASDNPAFLIERDADPELWRKYETSFSQIWNGAQRTTS
jgi:transcriptional regulator with XRE-family HTH domain